MTCREYIELSKTQGSLLDYISIVTGLKFKNIADLSINQYTLNRLHSYIQQVKNVQSLERSRLFYYAKTRQLISEKTFNFDSCGTVFLMQTRAEKTTSDLELMVYMLAIAIQNEYDAENIDVIYNELLDENYINVYSFIHFFFRNFVNGLNKRNQSLITSIKIFTTKILQRLKR